MALPILQPLRRDQARGRIVTVADLIIHNRCTAACVAAVTTPTRCKCPCAGEFHGLVGNAHVDALIEARRAGLDRLTDLQVIAS